MADTIDESDARAIVRLLGDVAAIDGTLNDKRLELMTGLLDLIDADAWVWGVAGMSRPDGSNPPHSIFLTGGFADGEFIPVLKAMEHPDMEQICRPFYTELKETETHLTRLQQQIDPADHLADSNARKLWEKTDFGPVILSSRPTRSGEVSSLVIYRRRNRPLFSPRESKIAHILLSEVWWLHESTFQDYPAEGVAGLSPRLRQVMNCLLLGSTRKEIAHDLDLSVHTLGGYIKEIYHRFGVRSQTQLIRRFLSGDGGDTP